MGCVTNREQNQFNLTLQEAAGRDSQIYYKDNFEGNTLKSRGREYIRFFLDNPDYLKNFSPRLSDFSIENNKDIQNPFISYLSDEIRAQGDLRSWCVIHGLTLLLVNRNLSVDENDIDKLIDEVLEGIVA